MATGFAIVLIPIALGIVAIERWRRQTVRELQREELRALKRNEVWEAVEQLDRAA